MLCWKSMVQWGSKTSKKCWKSVLSTPAMGCSSSLMNLVTVCNLFGIALRKISLFASLQPLSELRELTPRVPVSVQFLGVISKL